MTGSKRRSLLGAPAETGLRVRPLAVLTGVGLVAGLGLWGCSDEIPTANNPGLIPVEAETFLVEIPFEAFADSFRVDGGYGVPTGLNHAVLARAAEGGEGRSHAVVRWSQFPAAVPVPREGQPTLLDSIWTPVGGDLILRVDSARVVGGESFEIRADRLLEDFDPSSVSWTFAVDTLGDRRSWSVPGGGERLALGGSPWFPSEGDSIVIPLDSATATALANPENTFRRVAVHTETEGAYLRLYDASLRLSVRPESRPDTTLFLQPVAKSISFMHSGVLTPSDEVVAVGGAPAWRSSFRFALPETITASGPVCGGAPTCTVQIRSDRIIYAGLVLTTTQAEDPLLIPVDSSLVDIRAVLAPQFLPRAPLGRSVPPTPRRLAPPFFRENAGAEVEVAVTRFLRDLLAVPVPGQEPLVPWVSIMSPQEPTGIGVATFGGPASATPPRLRLILTRSAGVTLP